MYRVVAGLMVVAVSAVPLFMLPASAKLPALSEEAKVKAADTAAKTAWTDKVGGYQLCRSMERTAEYYRKTAQASGKVAPQPIDTPPCTDPGAYVAPVAAAASTPPPLESSGAHSPPQMATAPPSSKGTAAEVQGTAKK